MEKFRDTKERTGKFFMNDLVLDKYARYLGIYATGVYMSLCRHFNYATGTCFPSKETMAQKLGISERKVYDAIKQLKELNLIQVTSQGKKEDGSYKNNVYKLLDKSHWLDPLLFYADGTGKHKPSARGGKTHRHRMPNKDTHSKDTNNKGDINIERTGEPINPMKQFREKKDAQ